MPKKNVIVLQDRYIKISLSFFLYVITSMITPILFHYTMPPIRAHPRLKLPSSYNIIKKSSLYVLGRDPLSRFSYLCRIIPSRIFVFIIFYPNAHCSTKSVKLPFKYATGPSRSPSRIAIFFRIISLPNYRNNKYLGHLLNDKGYKFGKIYKPQLNNCKYDKNGLSIISTRDIKEGEELYVSYGKQYWYDNNLFIGKSRNQIIKENLK